MTPPPVGLVGVGRWGRNILSTILRAGDLKLAWVASANPATRALAPGDCRVFPNWRDAVSGPKVEGVIVATPPATHAEVVEAFLRPGMSFFVEKPLTPDLRSTIALTERIKHRGARLMVDFIHLFHPAFAALTENLSRIGALASIHARAGNWGPFRRDIGVLWDWGPHDAAMCLAVTGSEPSKVSARSIERREVEGSLAESMVIDAVFDSCRRATIEMSNLRDRKQRVFEVRGEIGTLVYDAVGDVPLRFAGRDGVSHPIAAAGAPPLDVAMGRFAACIRRQPADRDDFSFAVSVARFLDAAERSLAAG